MSQEPEPQFPGAMGAATTTPGALSAAVIALATPIDPEQSAGASQNRVLVKDLDPLPRAGFVLAKCVLAILAVTTALLIVYVAVDEFWVYRGHLDSAYHTLLSTMSSAPPNAEKTQDVANYFKAIEAAKSAIEAVGARQKESREFAIQLAQLILLNLFLPVLTALLGYIFGTTRNNDTGGQSTSS